jgi:hypothetical protein
MKLHEVLATYTAIWNVQKQPPTDRHMDLRSSLKNMTRYAPLIAAIIAPTSTLYEIPALSQPWYKYKGVNVRDPAGSLALSGISLTLNIMANSVSIKLLLFMHTRIKIKIPAQLLVMRFSSAHKWWRMSRWASLIFWIIKVKLFTSGACNSRFKHLIILCMSDTSCCSQSFHFWYS